MKPTYLLRCTKSVLIISTILPFWFAEVIAGVNLIQRGTWPGSGASSVTVAGNFAYVAEEYDGFEVFDVSNPDQPRLVGNFNTSGSAHQIVVAGSLAYVADYSAGLQIIDVSNPAQPRRVGSYDTPSLALGVAVTENYVYVADFEAGLHVIDVNSPTQPRQVGGFDTPSGAYAVAVAGDYAYVADGDSLQVIDVSNPTQLRLLGSSKSLFGAHDVAVAGSHAYVAGAEHGLQVLDVSNATQPRWVGQAGMGGRAWKLALAGDYAYVTAFGEGLLVMDVKNPCEPQYVGRLNPLRFARGVTVAADRLYLVGDWPLLVILDIASAVSPHIEKPPISQSVVSGASVVFFLQASGTEPLTYQWYYQGRLIAGATNTTYSIERAFREDQGSYTVKVSNVAATVESTPAQLTVLLPEVRLWGVGTGITTSLREGATHRLAEGEDMTIEAQAEVDEEIQTVQFQWFKDGQPFAEPREVAAEGALGWKWTDALRFPAIRLADAGSYTATVTLEFPAPKPPAVYRTGPITLEVVPGPRIVAQPPAALLDQSVSLTVSIPGVPSLTGIRWSGPQGAPVAWTNSSLNLPRVAFDDAGAYEATVFHPDVKRTVRSAPYLLSVYPVIEKPRIVSQPRPHTGMAGGRAVFTVGATGARPLSYQWRKGQADLPGATNFYMTLARLTESDAADYRVRVSNASGSTFSDSASLILQAPPPPHAPAEALVASGRASLGKHTQADLGRAVNSFANAVAIAPQHAEANLLYGVARLFDLVRQPAANQFLDRLQITTSDRDLYAWSAEPMGDNRGLLAPPEVEAGEITAFLRNQLLPELRAASTNLARVGPAEIRVPLSREETTLAPVTVDQGDVMVLRAGLLMFEYLVRTAKSWDLSVQLAAIQAWLQDPRTTLEAIARDYPDLLTFSDANEAGLARAALEDAVDTYVQGAGLIHSRPAAVLRLFNLDTTDRSDEERFRQALLDLKASLQAAASLNEDAQWRIHLAPLADGTRSPRSVAPQFVGNQADAATLPEPAFAGAIVNVGPPNIILPAVDRMGRAGARVELAVLALGEEPLRFQWFKDDRLLAGATAPKLVIPSLTAADAGFYQVVVANRQGTNSSAATVKLALQPGIVAPPEPQAVESGRPMALQVSATGTEPLQYQWYHDGKPIAGATQSRYLLPDSRPEDAGSYTVRVGNGAGSVSSLPAVVTVGAAQGAFAAPVFAEQFDDSTFVQGPSRTVHDGRGGVFAYFQLLDMVRGLHAGSPIKLRESDLSLIPGFDLGGELTDTEALAVQPDGKVLIAGTRHGACFVVRVNVDGRLDPTFQAPAFGRGVRFINLYPDGRILLTATDSANANPNAIAVPKPTLIRLLPDGRPDASFSSPDLPSEGGTLLYAPPVLDGTGGIFIGGRFATVNGVARPNFARLLPDGSLDRNFLGTAGIAGGVQSTQVRGIGLQSGGKVVVVGDFRIPSTAPSTETIGALRFNRDGTHDTTFARVKISEMGIPSPGVRPRAMVVLPDDRILLVANTLVRLNTNGTLDRSFRQPQFGEEAYWISRAADGRIFVPGVRTVDGAAAGGIAVFDPDGRWMESLDPGGFGLAKLPTSFVVLPGDRIVVAGSFNRAGSRHLDSVAILENDGRPALHQFDLEKILSGAEAPQATVASGPNGTFYLLVTDTLAGGSLARVHADGTLDRTWNMDFQVRPNSLVDLLGDPDGSLVLLGGGNVHAALERAFIRRLQPGGNLDKSFVGPSAALLDTLGAVTRAADRTMTQIRAGDLRILARDASGRYLVALNTIGGEVRFLRLRADGREDTQFAATAVDQVSSPTSTLETVFDSTTSQQTMVDVLAYTDRILTGAAELPDGRILVCGRFRRFGNSEAPGLIRLNSNGTVDPTFHLTSGPASPEDPLAVPFVDSMVADSAGNVYVAGVFSEFNTLAAPGLARLNADGRPDPTFRPAIRLVDYGGATARLKLEAGRLYAAGTFAGPGEVFPRTLWRLEVGGPPTIASFLPPTVVGTAGGTFTFEVRAAGIGPFTYQWERDGVKLAGATSATLTLRSLSFANSGRYTVEVRNAAGSVRSSVTTLWVVPTLNPDGITITGAGDVQLTMDVIQGVQFVLEASSDLLDWQVLANPTPTSAQVVINDQGARGASNRFYRLKFLLPP